MRDVSGLCDRQTIHLVPRVNNFTSNQSNNNNNNNTTASYQSNDATAAASSADEDGQLGDLGDRLFGNIQRGGGESSVASLSGDMGLSLLAALLGVSSSSPSSSSRNVGLSAEGRVNGHATSENGGGGGGEGGGADETILGMGGLGELFRGMGIPMEGLVDTNTARATTANAADAAATATNTTATTSASSREVLGSGGGLFGFSSSDGTAEDNRMVYLERNSLRRQGARMPPFAASTSTRRVRRNAITSSSSSSSSSSNVPSSLAVARASAARLTEEDVRITDPGSVEPVRQGLLTLHTLLGSALPSLDNRQMVTTATELLTSSGVWGGEGVALLPPSSVESPVTSPLDSHRHWYRGQWLDVLDTVHQWLEATVVDIVLPSDVLPDLVHVENHDARGENGAASYRSRGARRSPPDAVVSANDLEGRRRLLLELVPRDDNEDVNESEESDHTHIPPRRRRRRPSNYLPSPDDGYYYLPRPENYNVQLLLIHYNGWPHRWDEWIRSDSERIRPFRTRTRHRVTPSSATGSAYGNGSACTYLACPTPQTVFSASPSTAIRDEQDMISERSGMLFELSRVVQGVNELLSATAHGTPPARRGSNNIFIESSHLPWCTNLPPSSEMLNNDGGEESEAISGRIPFAANNTHMTIPQLRQLAPLLDRLGRTLTDAAPHVAALADSLPQQTVPPSSNAGSGIDVRTSNDLTDEEADHSQTLVGRASHLYFGIGDNNTEETTGIEAPFCEHDRVVVHEETTSIIDPDLTDYINGMVNTARTFGGTGSGRNSNRDSTNTEQSGSSLQASYLASMGGGGGGSADRNRFGARTHSIGNNSPRVMRMGGANGGTRGSGLGGGPGIDIHIHAIVTGPGMGGIGGLGGFPFDSFGVGNIMPTVLPRSNHNHLFSAAAATAAASPTINNDDADLFSELYSESPDPVNLHGEDNSHAAEMGNDGFDVSAVSQIFEDCLSIDEEVSCDSDADINHDLEIVASIDTEIIDSQTVENNDMCDDNSIDGSILALSEIESQGSITSQQASNSTASITSVDPTLTASFPSLQVEDTGSDHNIDAPASQRSSPSLRNRLSRTLGRFSRTSRRSSGLRSRVG